MATEKEKTWLNEYLTCWNATEAARRAGYKWPDKQGHQKKAKFADEIAARIEEKKMTADEVLTRLADIARGNIGDFLTFEGNIKSPYIDLQKAKRAGLLKLIKKLKYNSGGRLEFELYDAQSALVQLGKGLGVFKDEIEHSGRIEIEYVNDWRND